jgi:glycosyltransferase involved in cell wall biosynthesis
LEIKILINYNPFYSNSASSNRWLTLINGLQELGVKIELIVVEPCLSQAEKISLQSSLDDRKIKFKYLNNKVAVGLWSLRYENYIGKYIRYFRTKHKIVSDLRGFKGFVWVDNDLILWRIIQPLRNKSFKLITEMSEFLDIHENNKGSFLYKMTSDFKKDYFEKLYFHSVDGLLLMTRKLFAHYSNFASPHPAFFHLPMTVDFVRFDEKTPCPAEFESPYISFVGVMNDAKDGVSILIKAFNSIKDIFPMHKIYLVGGWNYDTPNHLELIRELRLENRVFWMKEYQRDKIPSIICNADLLVLPRPDSKQAQGGFPTKLGEYLATGNPVCATTVGEIPDYLKDNESVFFAEPGSVEAFAQAMKRALIDPENAKRVGLNVKKVAQMEFNKDIQAKKLYQFLLDLQKKEK